MTTNAKRTQADKDFRLFMTLCIACFYLFCFAVSAIDCMIIA